MSKPKKQATIVTASSSSSILKYFSPQNAGISPLSGRRRRSCRQNKNNNSSIELKNRQVENIIRKVGKKKLINDDPIIISSEEDDDFENVATPAKKYKKTLSKSSLRKSINIKPYDSVTLQRDELKSEVLDLGSEKSGSKVNRGELEAKISDPDLLGENDDQQVIISDNTETIVSGVDENKISIESSLDVAGISKTPENFQQSGKDNNVNGNADQEETLVGTETREGKNEKIAYYLLNFQHVIDTVLGNDNDRSLFEGTDDIAWIEKFNSLPVENQKLYVRLYHRKLAWLRSEQVRYPDVAENIAEVLDRLSDSGFLESFNEHSNEALNLREVLNLMPAPSLKELARSYRINVNGKQKGQIAAELEELCKNQKSIFGGFFGKKSKGNTSAGKGLGHSLMKRACKLLGPCYRVSLYPRTVFNRLLLVFDVTRGIDDETDCSLTGSQNAQGQGRHLQLSAILLAGWGKVTYPDCAIHRPTPIFLTRSDLLHYETAFQFQADILSCVEASLWKEAAALCKSADEVRMELESNDAASCGHAENLPIFLRCFTAQWTYTRLRSLEVEILQRLKNYKRAVEILIELLDQKIYCTSRRGHWWERLALNADQHLKDPERSLEVIYESLNDSDVRVGHKLALAQRVSKILSSRAVAKSPVLLKTYQTKLEPMIERLKIEECPVVEITGRLLPNEMQTGKSRFVTMESEGLSNESTLLCSVEELALSHYRTLGYEHGIHGEGGTFSTLFCLAMWDIIFMPGIPDVFRTSYQTHPLDFHTDEFYLRRKDAIEGRLQLIANLSTAVEADKEKVEMNEISEDADELNNLSALDLMSLTWDMEFGKACAGMNWERFTTFQEAKGFVLCIGGVVLAGIFRRMAKDLRHTRSGLPDLVVWNPADLSYKMVEVKGPGDRLSTNQKLWIDELIKLGANIEVCKVIAIAGKKLSKD